MVINHPYPYSFGGFAEECVGKPASGLVVGEYVVLHMDVFPGALYVGKERVELCGAVVEHRHVVAAMKLCAGERAPHFHLLAFCGREEGGVGAFGRFRIVSAQSPFVAARYHARVFDVSPEKYIQQYSYARYGQEHRNPGKRFYRIAVFRKHYSHYGQNRGGIYGRQSPVNPVERRCKGYDY